MSFFNIYHILWYSTLADLEIGGGIQQQVERFVVVV